MRSSPARSAATVCSSEAAGLAGTVAASDCMLGLRDGVDADQLDPQVAQPVEQPIQLRLIDQIGAKRGLTVARHERDTVKRALQATAQPAPYHDLVALPRVGTDHGGKLPPGLGELSSPRRAFHPGETAYRPVTDGDFGE